MTVPLFSSRTDESQCHSSGITVIVVGLGLAGLTTAIECHRKGHSVIAIDKVPEIKPEGGDGIGVTFNAARVISQWANGAVEASLLPFLSNADTMDSFDSTGRFRVRAELHGYKKGEGYMINRGALVWTLYQHAKDIGVYIQLGCEVTKYWETDEEAGVEVDGKILTADCVVCGDGVHSKARGFVTTQEVTPYHTGYAIFRAYFGTKEISADPDSAWILEDKEGRQDRFKLWFGYGMLLSIATLRGGQDICWTLTHEDFYGAEESWTSRTANIDNVLDCIRDWPVREMIEPILRKTPPERLLDNPIVMRPSLSTWVSQKARIILIGDAAHPVVPLTGQGGSQAVEDGAVVAIALQLAGKGGVPLALRVTEKIRYRRAISIQVAGDSIQDAMMKADPDAIDKDPSLLTQPRPSWILGHDCQRFTYDEFGKVAEAIRMGKEYTPENAPVDGLYTVQHDFNGQNN